MHQQECRKTWVRWSFEEKNAIKRAISCLALYLQTDIIYFVDVSLFKIVLECVIYPSSSSYHKEWQTDRGRERAGCVCDHDVMIQMIVSEAADYIN